MTHLANIMPFATDCPKNPQNMPARLYSKNLTPRQATLLKGPYSRTPGKEASKTALGTLARRRFSPADSNDENYVCALITVTLRMHASNKLYTAVT